MGQKSRDEESSAYIIAKLDALTEAIAQIKEEEGETEFAQSMRQLLVSRLEKERKRLFLQLPVTTATS